MDMEDVFVEVLAVCLDRVADGDTPAACARDFPDFPDLEGCLELAAHLAAVRNDEPTDAWRSASEDRLAATQAEWPPVLDDRPGP
jgi:hypothetical protein